MARSKQEQELFRMLRARGLRRRVARTVAEAASRADGSVPKPVRDALGDLRSAVSELESRLPGRSGASGGSSRSAASSRSTKSAASSRPSKSSSSSSASKRSEAAKKAAETRKRNAAKRSTAAKKGARTRAKAR